MTPCWYAWSIPANRHMLKVNAKGEVIDAVLVTLLLTLHKFDTFQTLFVSLVLSNYLFPGYDF